MTRERWQEDAKCWQIGPDLFYVSDGEERTNNTFYYSIRMAKAICNGCPVRTECLEYALRMETPSKRYGIWGGTVPTERAKIMAERSRKAKRGRRDQELQPQVKA